MKNDEAVKVCNNTLIINIDTEVRYVGNYDDPRNADWIAEQHWEIIRQIQALHGVDKVEIEDVER